MTASTVKSTQVSNQEAAPPTFNDVGVSGGRVRSIIGSMEVATTSIDEVGDKIAIARIPSNARIHEIKLFTDDLDSHGTPTLAADLGLYGTNGVVADVDAYGSAIIAGQAAGAVGVNYANEARDIAKIGQAVWADALATADPHVLYDIVLTITTAAETAVAGTLAWIITYTID